MLAEGLIFFRTFPLFIPIAERAQGYNVAFRVK